MATASYGHQSDFRPAAIAELMREQSLSVTAFAKRIGVTRQAVGSYLAGVTMPQLATVLRMADAFGKPLSFFVERVDAGGSEPVPAGREDPAHRAACQAI